MKCEYCGKYIRINTAFPTISERYRRWIAHNHTVQKSGMGAAFCWQCWNRAEGEGARKEAPKLNDSQFV